MGLYIGENMKVSKKIIAIICIVFTMAVCIGTSVYKFNYAEQYVAVALTLKQGSTGTTVKTLQQKLKNWGYYTGAVDGIYGAQTVSSVKSFQRKNGLTVDGIAGPKTLAAMGISASASTSSGQYTSSDIYMLAKLIHAEARGESYVGQVAVGAVVLNRVKNASFPNSISGVVYQKGAFTCVSDGQINLEPDATSKKAAQDAMNGWDPSYGAIYYYNPKISTSTWILSRKTTVVIGNHVFAV